jgi:hypothetical protein
MKIKLKKLGVSIKSLIFPEVEGLLQVIFEWEMDFKNLYGCDRLIAFLCARLCRPAAF